MLFLSFLMSKVVNFCKLFCFIDLNTFCFFLVIEFQTAETVFKLICANCVYACIRVYIDVYINASLFWYVKESAEQQSNSK